MLAFYAHMKFDLINGNNMKINYFMQSRYLTMNRDDEFPKACLETYRIDLWLAIRDFFVETPAAYCRVRSLEILNHVVNAILILERRLSYATTTAK